MKLFHEVIDAQVITCVKGVYRQAKLYHRDCDLFARYGSGFVRLTGYGGTSSTGVRWVDISDSPFVQNNSNKTTPIYTGQIADE